jgi:hypothetical protein
MGDPSTPPCVPACWPRPAASRRRSTTVATCIVMEGPAFSTRAESELYRSWGASVIGMTALPEAKLAREAEIAYAMLALSTDYDCWHVSEAQVSVEAVIAVLHAKRRAVAADRAARWRPRCRARRPSCPTRRRSSMPSSPPPAGPRGHPRPSGPDPRARAGRLIGPRCALSACTCPFVPVRLTLSESPVRMNTNPRSSSSSVASPSTGSSPPRRARGERRRLGDLLRDGGLVPGAGAPGRRRRRGLPAGAVADLRAPPASTPAASRSSRTARPSAGRAATTTT